MKRSQSMRRMRLLVRVRMWTRCVTMNLRLMVLLRDRLRFTFGHLALIETDEHEL